MNRLERLQYQTTINDDDWGRIKVIPQMESLIIEQGSESVRIEVDNIPELLKAIKKAEDYRAVFKMQQENKKTKHREPDWNPDWKGDPNDPARWNGW